MRILQVNTAFTPGGAARVVNNISLELVAGGDECLIVAARGQMALLEHSKRISNSLAVYWNALMARCFDNDGFMGKRATRKLISIIHSYRPDIIHIHNLHGYYINLRILFDFLKTADIPVVWTLHDTWAFTGHCAYASIGSCDKWKSERGCCRPCKQLREYPSCELFGRVSKNFHLKQDIMTDVNNLTIVTPSRWLSDRVKESFLADYPVEVIYNGIDTNVFKPVKNPIRQEFRIGNKTLIVGSAMQWSSIKNINAYVALARKLSNKYMVMLIGAEDAWHRDMPKNMVCVPATLRPARMAQFYSAADLLVNLSSAETFGLVTVEAMACGTPVISFNNSAAPELINDSCGYLVNEEEGVDAIAEIIRSKSWRNITTRACIGHASKFSIVEQIEHYRALYRRCLMKEDDDLN